MGFADGISVLSTESESERVRIIQMLKVSLALGLSLMDRNFPFSSCYDITSPTIC